MRRGLFANHFGIEPINDFHLFGERHFGTDYLTALMPANVRLAEVYINSQLNADLERSIGYTEHDSKLGI